MRAKSRLQLPLKERLEPSILFILTVILGLMSISYGRKLDTIKTWNAIEIQAYSKPIIKEVIVEVKVAKVTAYSCGGLKTEAEISMNCPSLRSGKPKTANGTEPKPNKTMACDPSLMGETFDLEGYGEVTCTDTGGAIKGEGRFDLYVSDVQEAREFGVQYLEYYE